MRNNNVDPSSTRLSAAEKEFEKAIRPSDFSSFFGQEKVIENIVIFVQAARGRGEALDHVLLHGPPGLGKTTLSHIIANEMGVNLKVTSGPVIDIERWHVTIT
jgi:Holliday junction DNA helicase RuvB